MPSTERALARLPRTPPASVDAPATTPSPWHVRDPGAARPVRLWVMSDLHRDTGDAVEPRHVPEADVAVIAGDVGGTLVQAVAWAARAIRPHMPVVMVAGNHEFHGTVLADELARGQDEAARLGVDLLERRTVDVAGLRFSGCTLWTDYELDGPDRRSRAMERARRGMPDHRAIVAAHDASGAPLPFLPEHALWCHLDSFLFLHGALLSTHTHAAKQVVVTHHAPHRNSVDPAYAGDPLNPAFASDLGHMIAAAQPALWVHGHVHASADYRMRATRVVCNPKGYPGEDTGFDPALVVEVDRG